MLALAEDLMNIEFCENSKSKNSFRVFLGYKPLFFLLHHEIILCAVCCLSQQNWDTNICGSWWLEREHAVHGKTEERQVKKDTGFFRQTFCLTAMHWVLEGKKQNGITCMQLQSLVASSVFWSKMGLLWILNQSTFHSFLWKSVTLKAAWCYGCFSW